jgi:hypothetical protein
MNALAIPSSRLPQGWRRSTNSLQTASGSVDSLFALAGFQRRDGVAVYALRVVNHTQAELLCSIWILSRRGELVLANSEPIVVGPSTTQTARVPVWVHGLPAFDRVLLEVAGEGVHCIAEAPAPQANPRRIYATIATAAAALSVLFLAVALGVRATLPQIAAFVVPPETLAGTTVQAQYDSHGVGALSYVVTAPSGKRIQSGTLRDSSGIIPVAVPATPPGGAYVLQLEKRGPFGKASEVRVLNTVAPRLGSGARIESLAVRPPVAKPGETIAVTYAATADAGTVRLVDGDGTVWAQRPFSRNGETMLTVPLLKDASEMHVVLDVTKASTAAKSMAGLVVAGGLHPLAAAAAQPAPVEIASDDDPNVPATSDADGNATFQVLDRTVKGGQPIRVHIISPRNDMRIALTDAQSHEVTAQNVGAQANTVTLTAPNVTQATTYTIVATFTDGFGQESVVSPVTILP